jgi:hypothetical protein
MMLRIPNNYLTNEALFREILPDGRTLFVVDCQLQVGSEVHCCSGAGWSAAEAKSKMISEAAERYTAMTVSKPNSIRPGMARSTGFAAHTDRRAAMRFATFELLERSFLGLLKATPSLKPAISAKSSWAYQLSEHAAWCGIARVKMPGAIGWGAAARSSADDAIDAAIIEAWMMASSKKHYSCSGNAISTILLDNSWPNTRSITRDWPEVRIMGERRFVCQAYWA